MSTKSMAAAVLASAGVLAAGWQIGTANGQTLTTAQPTTTSTTQTTPATQTTTTPTSSDAETESSSTTGTESTSTKSSVSGTFTGTTVSNRYGTVAVTVTLSNGKITDVQAETTTHDHHSEQYVSRAVPTLREEVIAANSADVDTVSGATFTSESYLTSLQSALDKAGV